jgi:hypothetical protein
MALVSMNKQDIILVTIILIIVGSIALVFKITEKKNMSNALVYYEDKLVLTIDLTLKEQEYVVDGYNGPVTITAGNGKVKVEDEDSPLHLCSKQGYISKSYESIVCLPNKIVIKLEDDSSLDAIVK